MKSEIVISVIVPCYNLWDYIDRCIDSLRTQTFKEVEFIFVNDGSTDGTLTKLMTFKEDDSRVIVINKSNAGVSMARNDALKIARGEYVLFLDGDDFLDSNTCEGIHALVKSNELDLLIFNYNMYQNGKISRSYNHGIPEGVYCLSEFLKVVKCLPVSYKLYKRDIIIKHHVYFNSDIKYGEVFAFFLNYLCYCDKIGVSNCTFYNYTVRKGSTIHSLNYENEINILKTIIQIDNYAGKLENGIKNRISYHKAVFQLLKSLILAKYISLGLKYKEVKHPFSKIYNDSLMRECIRFIRINDSWSSQDKYISILLSWSLKFAYNTISTIYKCKRLLVKHGE